MAHATTRLVRKAGNGRPAVYLVLRDGEEIGLLEKAPNSRAATHPWKAFGGVGPGATYLDSFYDGPVSGLRIGEEINLGGKRAAARLVADYRDLFLVPRGQGDRIEGGDP